MKVMALLSLLLLIALCLANQTYCVVNGTRSIAEDEEDLELERQLKILKKPAIKTIQIEGDVYDCINIQRQPALDNPKLKNHKVQMRPTSYPKEFFDANKPLRDVYAKATLPPIGCPEGTVPIRRVSKEELRAAKHLSESLRLNQVRPQANDDNVKFYQAVLRLSNGAGTIYKGVKADINVYNLTIEPNHYSTTHLWISGNGGGYIDSLWAGWMVSPMLYGDGLTRFFVHWGTDLFGAGCFDTRCPGFVITSKDYTVGVPVRPISVYGGVQYVLSTYIYQDENTGNWWLYVSDQPLGYWPKALLPGIQYGGHSVAWGGLTLGPSNENSSPMGNGHYPANDMKTACFFDHMKIVDGSDTLVNPPNDQKSSNVECEFYGVQDIRDQPERFTMLYGGPGGECS